MEEVVDSLQAVAEVVQAVAASVPEAAAEATDQSEAITHNLLTANNIWMMLATALVFIMHLGFACVETGLTRAKNTVNILFKNTVTPAIGLLTYTFIYSFIIFRPCTLFFTNFYKL